MRFIKSTKAFHQAALDYLGERIGWLQECEVFSWICLNIELKWENVDASVQWMIERKYFDAQYLDNLFDQYVQLEG